MPRKLSLDFETRSRADLKKVGAYKYAEHPSTEVVVLAVKEGTLKDATPFLSWDMRQPWWESDAIELLRTAIEEGWEIHAYNSQFEWAHLKHACPRQFGLPVPKIEQLRCTAAMCRSAGLPPRLGQVAEFLKLEVQKDKMGAALIQKFSIPQKKTGEFIEWSDDVSFTAGGEKMTAAEAFQRFVDYCVNDVRTELAIAEVMKPFELQGFALDWFLADARMNDRGVPVDRVALENAYELYQEHERRLSLRFREITGGLNPKQIAKVLAWLKERGYRGSNIAKATREAFGNDETMKPEAREALRVAADLSFAAVKKIPAMLDWVMEDNRIRGSFMWCGAQKTWRWTSKGVQWQNVRKPDDALKPFVEGAYQTVRAGVDLDVLEDTYGNPYELIASLTRYFVRFDDENIYDLDYSSVEAKILPMLIECRRILDRFDSGEDIYTTTGKSLAKILKEKFGVEFTINRKTGKVVVLATQFQGGWNAVFTATGNKWKREWCEVAAKIVRDENPEFPAAWRRFQDTFIEAMENPGRWHKVTPYVSFGYTRKAPFPRMLMRLASGRSICWPLPQKDPITMAKVETLNKKGEVTSTKWERVHGHFESNEEVAADLKLGDSFFYPNARLAKTFRTWEISFYGHIENGHYGRVKTYGGDALQSATQGTGADLLANGVIEAEKQGFEPILTVHDQCLTPARGCKDTLVAALCTVPDWFKGFPLEAEADEVRSYCKN
jgi:DNA polymerase